MGFNSGFKGLKVLPFNTSYIKISYRLFQTIGLFQIVMFYVSTLK